MKIYVDLDHVDITEYTGIESGEYNTNKINFIFTPEYKDLVKVAIFGSKLDTDEPKFYKIYLSDDSCYLPSEVTTASDVISIGVYAFNVENGELKLRYSPTPVKVIVYEGSFREEAENSSSPTPTEIEQIMSRIISLEELTSDLDTRVEALESKSCDLDTLKNDVEQLKVDIVDLDERLDVVEGDLADTYSKEEIDQKLSEKVNTTTFEESQEAQDEKINYAELILSQLPKVTGEGNNISLSPTLKGKLESTVKGNISQNTLEGYNIAEVNTSKYTLTNDNAIQITGGGNVGALLFNGVNLKANTTYYLKLIVLQKPSTATTFSAYIDGVNDASLDFTGINNATIGTLYGRTYTPSSNCVFTVKQWGNSNSEVVKFQYWITTDNSKNTYEPYCGGIPSPNPNYPQDIQVVTGTQTLTISNEDNTESQTYTLHLGDLELAKIPNTTYIDKIFIAEEGNEVYDSLTQEQKANLTLGKWYKYGAIGKYTLTGNETFVTSSSTSSRTYYGVDYSENGIYQYSDQTSLPDFLCEKFTRRTQAGSFVPGQVSLLVSSKYVDFIFNPDTTEQQARTILTGMKSYFRLANASTTEITNETLLSDLEYIRTHAMSYSGTTNISSSGNLPIIITASALKQLS